MVDGMAAEKDGAGRITMRVGYVRNPQEGPTFVIGSMLVTIKASGAETGGRFSLIEVTIPPYFSGMWPHLHRQTSEAVYLAQGMLAVTLGEETMVVRQGSYIFVPPNQVHRVWNPAATQATFLSYYSPAGAEGFFEALAALDVPEGASPTDYAGDVWSVGSRFDFYAPESLGAE
jgi:quercetin dioxygenase-like cupin family protein